MGQPPQVSINPLVRANIPGIVDLQVVSKTGLLGRMDRKIVSLYYENILDCPSAVVRVAELNGMVAGFTVLKTDRSFSHGAVLARRPFALARCLMLSPVTVLRLFRAMAAPSGRKDAMLESELLYLVVAPNQRGIGLGRRLMDDAKAWFARLCAEQFALTIEAENLEAERFYLSVGAKKSSLYDVHGKKYRMFIFDTPTE